MQACVIDQQIDASMRFSGQRGTKCAPEPACTAGDQGGRTGAGTLDSAHGLPSQAINDI